MRWLLVSVATLSLIASATPPQLSPSAESAAIACRALETYNVADLKVTAVVFHQRDETQRSQLVALLHQHSGEVVEIQASDGKWQRAHLLRLKSCFGRGLLLLATPASIPEHAEFALRLPAISNNP